MADINNDSKIVGRHARYKAGQQVVVTWLVNTAAQYQDLSDYFQDLKKPKTAKRRRAVRVATHEIIELVRIIVNGTPPTIIPEDVFSVLEDVIASRREAHVFYSSQPGATDHEGHVAFINVLDGVRDMLRSIRNIPADKPPAKAAKSEKNRTKKDTLMNLFTCLEVQEPAAEALGSGDCAPKPKKTQSRTYELEEEQDESEFALWCFLQDLNDIRETLRALWIEVRQGEITLATAGFVTEVAFGMIHRAHNDFIVTLPQFESWISIANSLGLNTYINSNLIYTSPTKAQDAATPFTAQAKVADLLCASAHLLLRTYAGASSLFLKHIRSSGRRIVDGKLVNVDGARPASRTESILSSMLPEMVSLKEYSEPTFLEERREYAKDRLDKSGRHIWSTYRKNEFVDGLLEMTAHSKVEHKREPSMWMSAISATIMDVEDQLGSNLDFAGDDMLQTANTIAESINKTLEFYGTPEHQAALTKKLQEHLESLRNQAKLFVKIIEGGRALKNEEARSAIPAEMVQQIHKMKSRYCAIDALPHFSGYEQHLLRVNYHDLSLEIANQDLVVLSMAHFYKAAQHYGLVTIVWHDMDFVIAQHSSKKSFVTKTAPTAGPDALVNHYLLDLGVDLSALTGGKIPALPPPATVISKSKKLAIADSGFRAALVARMKADEKLGVSRGSPFDVVLGAMTEAAHATPGPGKQQPIRIGPRQLLETLKKDLVADEPRVNFNYVEFTTFCRTITRKLLEIAASSMTEKEYSNLKWFYGLTHSLLRSAADAKASSRPVANTPFGKAAVTMQKMLADGDNAKRFSKAALNQSSGRVPKAMRPQFSAPDEKFETAIDALRNILPGASIGTSRQTIEVYDPSGSHETLVGLLNKMEGDVLQSLMPNGPDEVTKAILSKQSN